MEELRAHTHGAFGWVVGVVGDEAPLPLFAYRCLQVTEADGTPDWVTEAGPPPGLLAGGLSVVGFYKACSSAAPETELTEFVRAHEANLRDVICPEAWPSASGAFAIAIKLDLAPSVFGVTLCDSQPQLTPRQTLTQAEAQQSLRGSHIGLRARVRLSLQVCCTLGGATEAWADQLTKATGALHSQLISSDLRFFFPDAPQLGVLSTTGSEQPLCGAVAGIDVHVKNGDGAAEVADDEEDDGDDDEEEEEARSRAKAKKGPKGRKGGKKGGGRGRRTAGAETASALEAAEAAAVAKAAKAAAVANREVFSAEAMWLGSTDLAVPCASPTLVLEPKRSHELHELPLRLDALVFERRDRTLATGLAGLRSQLLQQLAMLFSAMAAAADSIVEAKQLRPIACVLQPPQLAVPVTALYLLRDDDDETETSCRQQREELHKRLGLPSDRPLLRSSFVVGASGGNESSRLPGLLRDVHAGLPPSGVKGGSLSLVQGSYEYYHYLQWTGHGQLPKPYDDNGWGCAYRSLMSIISWYRLQSYTAFENPTHFEIQKRLVDHCGQPEDELLGKKQWLGSQDVSLFLGDALGVTCKILECPSGDDVAANARTLAHHFDTQGSPVMIGGGELAFTLLGVDFNPQSGDARFLIMDPHYVGPEDLSQIRPKWVGWKTPDSLTHLGTKLFHKDKHYNLCLPQRPSCV